MGPSTVTGFVHIIASQEDLWREHWWLLTIFQLQSSFHNLSERNGAAGTTMSLVSKIRSEVISIDVSEI
jgi:hypothetical protein